MKVKNMENSNGRAVPNQFVIEDEEQFPYEKEEGYEQEYHTRLTRYFQSYQSIIVKIVTAFGIPKIYLDINKWDYSITTGKYRNQFLGETKKETQAKIDSGEYVLTDLN